MREQAAAEVGQDVFGVAQGVRSRLDVADRDPDHPRVAQAGGALVA